MSATNDINLVLQEVCSEIGGFTAAVMIFDEKEELLKTKYSYNLPESWAALTNTLDTSTDNGTAFIEQRTVIRNKLRLPTLRSASPNHPIETVIVVPLSRQDRRIGTLVVLGDGVDVTWGKKEERVVKKVAQQIVDCQT